MKWQTGLLIVLLAFSTFAADVTEPKQEEQSPEQAPAAEPVKPEVITPAPVETVQSAASVPAPTEAKPVTSSSPWFIGPQLGQLRSNNSDSGRLEKTTYSAGGFIEYRLMDQWFLQAELNYLNKGWRVPGTLIGDEVSLKYFEVPLFFKIKFPWNNLSPALMAGPWVAYLHSASNTLSGVSFDTTSATKRFEYGLYLGAEINMALSENLELGLGARYGWGLSDINTVSLQDSVFNRVLHLLAGIRFRL